VVGGLGRADITRKTQLPRRSVLNFGRDGRPLNMMTLEEAHATLDKWYDECCVGNILFYRGLRGKKIGCNIEHTTKVSEMSEEEKGTFYTFFNTFDFSKAELARNNEGEPDRIKTVRSFSCKSQTESTPNRSS
jgi:hypothetical protein